MASRTVASTPIIAPTGVAKAPQATGGVSTRAPGDNVPSSPPVLMGFLVRPREYRRPRLWVGVRVACGIFNVVLGVLLLVSFRQLPGKSASI